MLGMEHPRAAAAYPHRVARGLPPPRDNDDDLVAFIHPAASASSLRRVRLDMLRETCPEDMDVDPTPPRQHPRPPSAWVIFAPPLGLCFGVVALAAFHSLVGAPLGPEFAAEVWGFAKLAIWPTVASTAIGAYVHMQHRAAQPPSLRAGPGASLSGIRVLQGRRREDKE